MANITPTTTLIAATKAENDVKSIISPIYTEILRGLLVSKFRGLGL
jgi:hypothetical protein